MSAAASPSVPPSSPAAAPAAPPPMPPEAVLMQLVAGKWLSKAVSWAARLGVADHLVAGPRPVAELATLTGTHPEALYRLLRATASAGVFAETGDRRFALTPMGELLRSGVAGSLRNFCAMIHDRWQDLAWAEMGHALRTNTSGATKALGRQVFAWFEDNPEAAALFDGAMVDMGSRTVQAVLEAFDFTGIGVLADVGGGRGHFAAAIARKTPGLKAVVFDRPQVAEGAARLLAEQGVADRVRFEAGDFFQAVPAGADAYFASHIIHDWNDQVSGGILRRCRTALGSRPGRMLLCETVIPPGNEPHFGKLLDLEMLMAADAGKERTEAEFAALFAGAGWRLNRIVPTRSPVCVIEALPA